MNTLKRIKKVVGVEKGKMVKTVRETVKKGRSGKSSGRKSSSTPTEEKVGGESKQPIENPSPESPNLIENESTVEQHKSTIENEQTVEEQHKSTTGSKQGGLVGIINRITGRANDFVASTRRGINGVVAGTYGSIGNTYGSIESNSVGLYKNGVGLSVDIYKKAKNPYVYVTKVRREITEWYKRIVTKALSRGSDDSKDVDSNSYENNNKSSGKEENIS